MRKEDLEAVRTIMELSVEEKKEEDQRRIS